MVRRRAGIHYKSGFTLIEIMVVIMIIGAVLTVAGPRLFRTTESYRSEIRHIAILTREIRSNSRLYGNSYRIVITMNPKKEYDEYRIESASGVLRRLSEEREKDLERLTKEQREQILKGRPQFSRDKKYPQNIRLPKGLRFLSVETTARKGVFSEGDVPILFQPEGLSDAAVIQIGDRKNLQWTIAIEALTGRASIFERPVTLEEFQAI